MSVDALEAMVRELPEHTESIRHWYWRDPVLREICNDHRDALEVWERLKQAVPREIDRIQEYRGMANELREEAILRLLECG
jgi:hypothetical protein